MLSFPPFMTGISKFKMAPKGLGNISWIIFACSVVSTFISTDGAPLYVFNGTKNHVGFTEHNAHNVSATVNVVYEGHNYKSFFISHDGYVMFSPDMSDIRYIAQDWSVSNVSPFIDKPFIAPYYYDGHALDVTKGYVGKVYYQEITSKTGNEQDLLKIGQYVTSMMIGGKQFSPSWGMVISWENVTSDDLIQNSPCDGTSAALCQMNTFQLVLLSDGSVSYAIFNYHDMNVPVQKYDQAGFNGGDGIGFYNVLGQSVDMSQLSNLQSSDVAGRYIFDISSGTILRGGCSNDKTDTRLSVVPNYAGMFGGKVIDISGPCFPASLTVPRCMFTDAVSKTSFNGTVIGANLTRMRCVVPRMTVRGRVMVSVSVDNGLTYPYKQPFTIVFPGRMPGSEHVTAEATSTNMAWFDTNPTSMTLSWNPALLTNTSHSVDVTLYGYREAGGQLMYTVLTKLASNVDGRPGSYSVDPSKFQCTGQTCFDYEVGLIEVRLQDGATPQTYKYLSSKVIPLGWYVNSAMTSQYGANWPTQMCVNWFNADMQDTTWTTDLLSCPCSLSQAIADYGRYQPDNGCNLMNSANPNNCFYHKGAVHCVRAVQPTPGGAGNQCCYNKDGGLVFAADSFQGSTPDRSHDWGAAPYGKPGYVPTLSHWIKDVVSFYYCCLWTGYNSCDYYMDARPTKDCIGYTPPVLASVFGQGHVMSFGGRSIRIQGPGEYVLFKAGNTILQGRFENLTVTKPDKSKVTYSYILSGVAIQDVGTSDKVELTLRTPNFDRSVKLIDVRVNGQLITFNEDSMRWQDFKGVAVANTDHDRKLQSNFTVMLTNGIGFQVAEVSNTLQLDLMAHSSVQANVSGLFGTLGGNMTRPNGTAIDSTISDYDLFFTYELLWAVEDQSKSLFIKHLPANYSTTGLRFDRQYLDTISGGIVNNICKTIMQCSFDYRTTGSLPLARGSLQARQRYMALSDSLQPVRTCGLLNVPRSKKTNYNTVLGTQTTLTGCRSGSLSGSTSYTCLATSNATQAWSPDVSATCRVPIEEAATILIVAILVPCVVVLFIAIIIAVCCYKKRKNSDKMTMRTGEAQNEDEKVTMKTDV